MKEIDQKNWVRLHLCLLHSQSNWQALPHCVQNLSAVLGLEFLSKVIHAIFGCDLIFILHRIFATTAVKACMIKPNVEKTTSMMHRGFLVAT